MLSDFLIEKNTKGEAPKIRTQIKRLENLSISMSNLIASGNSDKIMHLEKIRKKIIQRRSFRVNTKSHLKI